MPSALSRVRVTVRLVIACNKSSSRVRVSEQTSPAKSAAAVGLPLSHSAVDQRPSAIAAFGATLASRAAAAGLQAPLANFLTYQCPGISDKALPWTFQNFCTALSGGCLLWLLLRRKLGRS